MLKSELIAKLNEHDFDCKVVVVDEGTGEDATIEIIGWLKELNFFEIRVWVNKDEARDEGFDDGWSQGFEEGKEAD